MTALAEPGWLVSCALALTGVLLLGAAQSPWMRLHGAEATLSSQAIGLRVTGVGLLSAAATLALLAALALLPADPSGLESWRWLLRGEILAALGLAALIYLLEGMIDRLWILLGAVIAGAAAGAGAAWLVGHGVEPAFGPAAVAVGSAGLAALQLSPGPMARLVIRVRKIACALDGHHVLLIDRADRVLYMSEPTRSDLGLERTPTRLLAPRESLPRAMQEFVTDGGRERARMRTPSGLILEARLIDLGQHGRLRAGARAILLRNVTDEHRGERRLVKLAHYDSLTGLANRRLFLETLKKTLEDAGVRSERAALFYIDLDGFKAINDSLGHAAGDAMLSGVADRFRTHLRPDQVSRFGISRSAPLTTARLAGDEFAVIAPRIPDGESAGELARYMIEFLRSPLDVTDRTLSPSASIGIALFPEHGDDVETLLRHADSALYVAKSRGRQRFAWYESSLNAKAERARLLEAGLRFALERDEMRLHYQPKVDAHSGELVGLEALARWRSPDLGDVGPDEFIKVAEARGLIAGIGAWSLEETCRQIRAWQDAGLAIVPVSVNVSSSQFAESDLMQEVSEALQRHGLDPSHLELELTESLLLDERYQVEQVLRDLRSIGVRIALDDFGTGYSALTYLNRFSLDVLKMDRDLLRDVDTNPSAHGIASAVVAMAHSLGLTVVAEGVDMPEQLPLLREMDCDQIQGFIYAPALPPDEVVRFMCRAGEEPVKFGCGMSVPGQQGASDGAALPDEDEPVLRGRSASRTGRPHRVAAPTESGRVLLVDDGQGSLGTIALRLGHLGIDIHYASAVDEAHLFVAQEREGIRLVVFPPQADLDQMRSVLAGLTEIVGERRRCVAIGERPGDEVRLRLREMGVDWVLWAPFNDAELRYVVKSAMTLREDLVDRREVRVPVDLVANLWSGDRREVAVVSSLSPRGAFIELSEPLGIGSSLRIEMEVGGDRFRGFARVVHTQDEDPDRPNEPSGVGVAFYGTDRDQDRLLRKAISELESRYLP